MQYDVTILKRQNKDNLLVEVQKVETTIVNGTIKPKKPKQPSVREILGSVVEILKRHEEVLKEILVRLDKHDKRLDAIETTLTTVIKLNNLKTA
jgi:hypothetical protein